MLGVPTRRLAPSGDVRLAGLGAASDPTAGLGRAVGYDEGMDEKPQESPQTIEQSVEKESLPLWRRIVSLPLLVLGAVGVVVGIPSLLLFIVVENPLIGHAPRSVMLQSAVGSIVGAAMLLVGFLLRRPSCRFQFRLRTLMIVVTLLAVPCAYIGWQESIVTERWAMRKRIEEVDEGTITVSVDHVLIILKENRPQKLSAIPIPWIRRILGDEPIERIVVPLATDREERRLIQRVFPEAALVWFMPNADERTGTFMDFRAKDSGQ
jgi:hypothetical protein